MATKKMITSVVPNVYFDQWTICDGSIDRSISTLQEIKRKSEEQGFTQIGLNLNNSESDYFNVNIRGSRLETDKEFEGRLKQEKRVRDKNKKQKELMLEKEKEMLRRLKRKYPDV